MGNDSADIESPVIVDEDDNDVVVKVEVKVPESDHRRRVSACVQFNWTLFKGLTFTPKRSQSSGRVTLKI